MAGFSIKQVKAILSEHNMPVDDLQSAAEELCERHVADLDSIKEQRDNSKGEVSRLKSENDRLTGELQKANAETQKAQADLKAAADKAEADAKAAAETAKADADKRVQAEVEKLTALQSELDALKAQHEAAQKAVSDLTLIKNEYEQYKAEQEAKVTTASKEEAFRGLLQDMNLSEKGISLAMKYTDMNAVELNDKGKISNAAALKKAVTEDWGDYIMSDIVLGADTATPPANVPVSGKTAAEILAIEDDAELTRAIEANPAAFGLA